MYYAISAYFEDKVTLIYAPLFVIAIITFIIGTMFMTVWGMAADSIL